MGIGGGEEGDAGFVSSKITAAGLVARVGLIGRGVRGCDGWGNPGGHLVG